MPMKTFRLHYQKVEELLSKDYSSESSLKFIVILNSHDKKSVWNVTVFNGTDSIDASTSIKMQNVSRLYYSINSLG